MNIIQKPSPNFKLGRDTYKPEIIVIHIMAGTLTGTDSWFGTSASEVSAHYGIGHNGEIHQYVDERNVAWQAGRVSGPTFKLSKLGVNPNLYTIGIEHEGMDLSKDGTQAQLEASAALIRDICIRWAIPMDRDHIIGHYQVFDQKPNCPATDKTIIDTLIKMVNEPMVNIPCPQSKVERIKKIIEII